jgi:hypothetical protein
METLVFILIIAAGNTILPIFLPWWIMVPFNFLAVLPFRISGKAAFWLGGFATGMVWLSGSLWMSYSNQHILAGRITQVLGFGNIAVLFLAEFLLPFLLGGIACMTGTLFKKFKQTNG